MSDLADIQWFSGESDGPQPRPQKCPLPRIGSKEWGWEWDERQQMYTSPKTSIDIQPSFGNTRIFRYYDVIIGLDGVPLRIGASLILRDAKILAEVRARRDWRKEHGKR